jgi:carbamoyltransferase
MKWDIPVDTVRRVSHLEIERRLNDTYTTGVGWLDKALDIGWPDRIFWYERPWVKKARQLYAGQYSLAMDINELPSIYLNKIGLYDIPILYTPHHGSHAAAGYYSSPFNHCAIVVLDAIGEFECATIWEGKHGEMRKVWSRSYPNSLGLFYSAFTKLIGLEPIKDEYLLQQMSHKGDVNRFKHSVRQYFNKGTLNLNYNFHKGVQDWFIGTPDEQYKCDIAAAVQFVFEEQISQIMNIAQIRINADSLVYMGGCAMNSRANLDVVKKWKHVWSLPNPGDPSSAIGAVLYHTKNRNWNYNLGTVKHITITA